MYPRSVANGQTQLDTCEAHQPVDLKALLSTTKAAAILTQVDARHTSPAFSNRRQTRHRHPPDRQIKVTSTADHLPVTRRRALPCADLYLRSCSWPSWLLQPGNLNNASSTSPSTLAVICWIISMVSTSACEHKRFTTTTWALPSGQRCHHQILRSSSADLLSLWRQCWVAFRRCLRLLQPASLEPGQPTQWRPSSDSAANFCHQLVCCNGIDSMRAQLIAMRYELGRL